MNAPRIEILFFDGCPHVEPAIERVRAILVDAPEPAELALTRVTDEAAAVRLRFLGSPTVRVDGKDVEPGAEEREGFGLQCRLYEVDGRAVGVPPIAWIRAALQLEMPLASAG